MIVCVVLALCIGWVTAYPSGAPDVACADLQPQHGASAQTSAMPYDLTFISNPGGSYTITLTAKGTGFKGFLIAPVNKTDNTIAGSFKPISSGDVKNGECKGAGNDITGTITHTNGNAKTSISADWTPLAGATGDVCLSGAVVQAKVTWWKIAKTTCITLSGASVTTPVPSATNSTASVPVSPGVTSGVTATAPVTKSGSPKSNGAASANCVVTPLLSLLVMLALAVVQ